MLKKENGVTLVALVITIIVLLILAGVTLAMVLGDNGIFDKANDASSQTTKTSCIDAVRMALLEAQTNSYTEANNYTSNFKYANLDDDTKDEGKTFVNSMTNSGYTKVADVTSTADPKPVAGNYSITDDVSETNGVESGNVTIKIYANGDNKAFEVTINSATGAITTGTWVD